MIRLDHNSLATVEFQLTVKSTTRERTFVVKPSTLIAPSVAFRATFAPGPPESIVSIVTAAAPAHAATFRPGDSLPTQTLACLDRYGNRVVPVCQAAHGTKVGAGAGAGASRASDWKMTLMCEELSQSRIVRSIDARGEVAFSGLTLKGDMHVPLAGIAVECDVQLSRSQWLVNEDKDIFPDLEAVPALTIPFRVLPTRIPGVVKVCVLFFGLLLLRYK